MKWFLFVLLLVDLSVVTAHKKQHKHNADGSYIDYSEADEIMRVKAATVVYETTEQSKIIMQQIEAEHGEHNVEGAVKFRAWEDEENWYAEFYNAGGMQLAVGCCMKQ